MSSRKTRAMGELIAEICRVAAAHPCAPHGTCLPCEIANLIHRYRRCQARQQAAEGPPKAEQNPPSESP